MRHFGSNQAVRLLPVFSRQSLRMCVPRCVDRYTCLFGMGDHGLPFNQAFEQLPLGGRNAKLGS
jgi:hypothetical protein